MLKKIISNKLYISKINKYYINVLIGLDVLLQSVYKPQKIALDWLMT